ncbi:hypothetical protein [Calothrix sp. PCC 6303]|uniref:hypothetical protein n=1 Tax=Calothrix sp. PCC 6303 TaxID=1170562 RepID=UPI0002A04441|nr:hypothetical protein [Calothrix sp. PCC 6303]AFZ04306.1 hypothetical protein Cal6303_5423 [Calothrix sp. PCC 6303]
MLENPLILLGITQIPVTDNIVSPETASLIFSGPKFLVALLAGILMAFAFQLLLTNFSLAVGISSLSIGSGSDDDSNEGLGETIRQAESKIGFWALITSTIALFAASFLAVKLSLIESALLGGIIGVVIWSSYFTLIVWLGSSAVGSLIGSFVNTVSSGVQGLMGTATTALGANAAKQQMVSTVEEITATVRRELTSGLDPESIKNSLQSSVSSLKLPSFDVNEIRNQFDKLLKDVDLTSVADGNLLKNVNRQTFVDLVSSRTDFSPEDVDKIAEQLEAAWKQFSSGKGNPTEQVISLINQASPEELNSEKLTNKLQELVASGTGTSRGNGFVKQAIDVGVGAALPVVLKKINISDIDVNKVTNQLQKLKGKVENLDTDAISQQLQHLKEQAKDQVGKVSDSVNRTLSDSINNTVKADIEEYIANSLPWHLNRITIADEFQELIFDIDANPATVSKHLQELNQEYFTQLLQQRGDFDKARIAEISQQMETIRTEVLATVQQQVDTNQSQDFRTKIEDYLRSTGKNELNPEGIKRDFGKLLENPEAALEQLNSRFQGFDRDTLVKLLEQREDISSEEANNIVSQLEENRDRILNQAQELQEKAKAKAAEVRQGVEDYLRNTNLDELNPEGIQRDFSKLLEDPEAGLSALRGRLSQFDRETLVKLLSQRQDLSEEQVNKVIDNLLSVRDKVLQAPQEIVDKTKEQYEKTTSSIAQYLRDTNLDELNPEGIQQDLQKLLDDPQSGASALKDRLSQVDRETLVKLLTQRGDLSEEQINRNIDNVEAAIGKIVKAPRRLAKRTTEKVRDFQQNLASYLQNTNKEELNPEGIKRDLQLLLSSPRAGISSLTERVGNFDRSTIVALLSQREDISEEEANRIVDQIESTRNSIVEQFQQIQQKMQSVIDGSFEQVRSYLNSLERPELNYEGIQQDFSKLFDDPEAGFDALRDRLGEFDRDTLVAIISSRPDISNEQAEQIVNRMEAARDSVIHRAERIQKETQKRLKAIKKQAKEQAAETQKTVAGAAWWLFNTAFVSLAASAIAGVIAVTTPNPFG